jgi:hypothetical protein
METTEMAHHCDIGLRNKAALRKYVKAGYYVGTFTTGDDKPVRNGTVTVTRPPASTVKCKPWTAKVRVKSHQVVAVL